MPAEANAEVSRRLDGSFCSARRGADQGLGSERPVPFGREAGSGHTRGLPAPAPRMSPKPRRKPETDPAAAPPRTPAAGGGPAIAWNAAAPLTPTGARAWIIAWIALGALAAVLIAMALGPHRVGDYFTESDFYGAYADSARLIQRGRLVPSRYGVIGPGYEVALAMAGVILRDLLLAAELLSIVGTLAIAWLWFDLARRRLDARVGALLVVPRPTPTSCSSGTPRRPTRSRSRSRAWRCGPCWRAHPTRSPARARSHWRGSPPARRS